MLRGKHSLFQVYLSVTCGANRASAALQQHLRREGSCTSADSAEHGVEELKGVYVLPLRSMLQSIGL